MPVLFKVQRVSRLGGNRISVSRRWYVSGYQEDRASTRRPTMTRLHVPPQCWRRRVYNQMHHPTLLCLRMGWRTALVTGDLHDFILRALDLPRVEPGVELVQGANIFARKRHPGIMYPVKST